MTAVYVWLLVYVSQLVEHIYAITTFLGADSDLELNPLDIHCGGYDLGLCFTHRHLLNAPSAIIITAPHMDN